jgi:hypothetical protein
VNQEQPPPPMTREQALADLHATRYWHHALHEGKPPRLIAPSTAQKREARQQRRRRKDAS